MSQEAKNTSARIQPKPALDRVEFFQEKSVAGYLGGIVEEIFRGQITHEVTDCYLVNILDQCNATDDPMERMLVEQIAMAHHAIGRLHFKAAQATNAELISVYHAAAARLIGEFRRCVLALKEYRSAATPANVTLVKQQNVAENQQVAMMDANANSPAQKKDPNSELLSNDKLGKIDHVQQQQTIPQPAPATSRQAQPVEAGPADPIGTPTLANFNKANEALAKLNGAANGGGQAQGGG